MRVPELILRERLQRLGRPGLLGGVLLLLALGHTGFGLLPAWRALAQLEQSTRQALALRERLADGRDFLPPAPGRQLDDFHQGLPAQLDATRAIDHIYLLAGNERISLARGEYALGIDPRTRLARYQILLPVRGSYPQLRRFLHGVLAEVPALVLEEVDFQRRQISDTELEGRIRMTLYLSRL